MEDEICHIVDDRSPREFYLRKVDPDIYEIFMDDGLYHHVSMTIDRRQFKDLFRDIHVEIWKNFKPEEL